ncbi:cell invasion protein SipA [uncultured Selenomonas sp.]|uniref:cell invasion protein SipA n=1 Tax=uncultured Selenomonas sp. TaxID=159275 RepID=UPI0028ED6F67|nr:cell invasion protein SipA [uncultured Selenomonas sp.]
MMNTKMMKKTAVAALVGVLGYGAVGAAEVSASALNAPQRVTQTAFTTADGSADVQQLAWGGKRDRDRDRDRDRRDRDRREKRSGKKYSQGSMTTAAIVGAVVGAIIAKNT